MRGWLNGHPQTAITILGAIASTTCYYARLRTYSYAPTPGRVTEKIVQSLGAGPRGSVDTFPAGTADS